MFSYAAGSVSGIAMLIALVWLRESHPLLVDEEGNQIRRKVEQPKDIRIDHGKYDDDDMIFVNS